MATLILKCTERCNSNCVYCDATRYLCGVPDMPLATLETVFLRLNEFLLNHPEEDINFTWHGGEPLLLGPGYLEAAMSLQSRHCPNTGSRIKHSMQSNLTLLREEYIPVLKQMGLTGLGTSYDPDPHLRGIGAAVDSKAYSAAFLRGTSLLEKHGMSWGFIYVVTKKSLANPQGLFRVLSNLKPDGAFNMHPVIITREDQKDLAITPEEYADFLGAIFPYWYEHRDRYPDVEPYSSFLSNISNEGRRLGCVDSGSCAKRHICIDPAGEVSQCGRTCELKIMVWGSIHNKSIDELFAHEQLAELSQRTQQLREGECKGCQLFPICHGGCPVDAFTAYGTFNRKTNWCNWKRRFVSLYFEPVTGSRVGNLRDYELEQGN